MGANQFFYLFLYILAIIAAIEIGVVIYIYRSYKKFTSFFQSSSSLEGLISELLKKVRKMEGDFVEMHNNHKAVSEVANLALSKVYVKRFNPFGNEVGGDQSFVLASLDKQNTGFIISSLYLKEGNRLYVKPIVNGLSTYQLSEEEKEALEHCINQK